MPRWQNRCCPGSRRPLPQAKIRSHHPQRTRQVPFIEGKQQQDLYHSPFCNIDSSLCTCAPLVVSSNANAIEYNKRQAIEEEQESTSERVHCNEAVHYAIIIQDPHDQRVAAAFGSFHCKVSTQALMQIKENSRSNTECHQVSSA